MDRPKLNSFINQNQIQPEPLSIEEAFPYFVSELSPGKYEVMWNLAPGHYLYRHAFKFTLLQTKESEEEPVDFVLPDGLKKTDQFFGQIEAYYEKITVDLSLQTVPGPEAKIIIQYQGCADWGFCYPPQRGLFELHP
ncbi:MAG: protein-disulfide reductase DsbD N-terminal domain-containing protein [Gammaproteobacteria bacterium]|nr:protein-disulfide reductase DsbD N-terminal domain-containing protein [Gammaproteobacteria bacterium]